LFPESNYGQLPDLKTFSVVLLLSSNVFPIPKPGKFQALPLDLK
jgi:hypothetical protein